MLNNSTHQWVALYTHARAEKMVLARLKEAGFEAYLPLRHVVRRWSDRYKSIEVPVFSSYVFVKIRSKDVVPVRTTDGAVLIICFGGQPAVIPDAEIEAVRRIVDSQHEVWVQNNNALQRGARVRITGGDFLGMEGTLVSNCKEGNFSVSISGLNMSLVLPIDEALLLAL